MQKGCLLLALVMLLGCGGPPTVDTVVVKGKLVNGEQALTGKSVQVEGAPEGTTQYDGYQLSFFLGTQAEGSAQVDENGQFQVELPPGKKYKVVIARLASTPLSQPNRPQDPTAGYQTPQDETIKKFSSLSSTPIEIEVGSGDMEITIDLSKY